MEEVIELAQYELMYILKPDLGEEQLTEDFERVAQIVAQSGGTIEKSDKWGRRKLAYEVDGYTEGLYSVVTFQGTGDPGNEITRLLRIHEDVLRSIVVRVD